MQGVLASFHEIDSAVHAIEDLNRARLGEVTVFTPTPRHEFEPWQWTSYRPTWVDYAILCGSFGWFSMWFLLFIKQLPVIAISEVKEIVPPKLRLAHQHGIGTTGEHYDYEADTPGEHD